MDKIIRKLFIVVFGISILCGFVAAQDKPVLINRVPRYIEDSGNFRSLTLERIADNFFDNYYKGKPQDAFVALRVCSPDPLALTFARDEYDPSNIVYLIRDVFKTIPLSRVYLLRDDKCQPDTTKFYIEYWYVSKNADFPPFVEIQKIQDLKSESLIGSFSVTRKNLISDDITNDNIDLTPESYEIFKTKLVEKLKMDKTAFVLINYVNQRYSEIDRATRKLILKKAFQLRTYLISNGIGSYRICVKEAKDYYFVDDDSKPKVFYPDVKIAYPK